MIKDHNIAKIEVDYSGGGDDGCLDETRYEDVNGNSIDVKLDGEVEAEWDDLLYDTLSHHIEWDWINNDGGYGQMIIDCTKNSMEKLISIIHNVFVKIITMMI